MDIICDIDGTVADPTHRRHFVRTKPKNWPAFNAAAPMDPCIEPIARMIRDLKVAGHRVIFVSGREGTPELRKATADWLARHDLADLGDWLFMRKAGDCRADDIVKEEILDELLTQGFKPTVAFDDRNRVVEMWRRRGLICAQVAEGDF
jgi:hypothetical protein